MRPSDQEIIYEQVNLKHSSEKKLQHEEMPKVTSSTLRNPNMLDKRDFPTKQSVVTNIVLISLANHVWYSEYWDKKVSSLTLFRLCNPNMLRARNLRTNQNSRLHFVVSTIPINSSLKLGLKRFRNQ